MKISTNFSVKELVDSGTVLVHGEARSRNFIHPSVPITLEKLREYVIEKTGKGVTVNDYAWGGGYSYSGIRPHTYKAGAKFSTHRYGNTVDCKFKGITPVEVQKHIMDNPDRYPHIVRMENAEITRKVREIDGEDVVFEWLHVECGHRDGDIIIFNP